MEIKLKSCIIAFHTIWLNSSLMILIGWYSFLYLLPDAIILFKSLSMCSHALLLSGFCFLLFEVLFYGSNPVVALL